MVVVNPPLPVWKPVCDHACSVDKCPILGNTCLNPRRASRLQFFLVGAPGNQGIVFCSPISGVSYFRSFLLFHSCDQMSNEAIAWLHCNDLNVLKNWQGQPQAAEQWTQKYYKSKNLRQAQLNRRRLLENRYVIMQ